MNFFVIIGGVWWRIFNGIIVCLVIVNVVVDVVWEWLVVIVCNCCF